MECLRDLWLVDALPHYRNSQLHERNTGLYSVLEGSGFGDQTVDSPQFVVYRPNPVYQFTEWVDGVELQAAERTAEVCAALELLWVDAPAVKVAVAFVAADELASVFVISADAADGAEGREFRALLARWRSNLWGAGIVRDTLDHVGKREGVQLELCDVLRPLVVHCLE